MLIKRTRRTRSRPSWLSAQSRCSLFRRGHWLANSLETAELGAHRSHDVGEGPGSRAGEYIEWLTISDRCREGVYIHQRTRNNCNDDLNALAKQSKWLEFAPTEKTGTVTHIENHEKLDAITVGRSGVCPKTFICKTN